MATVNNDSDERVAAASVAAAQGESFDLSELDEVGHFKILLVLVAIYFSRYSLSFTFTPGIIVKSCWNPINPIFFSSDN